VSSQSIFPSSPRPVLSYNDLFRNPQNAPAVEHSEIRQKPRRSLQIGRVQYREAFPGPPMPFYYVSMILNDLPGRHLESDYGGGWFKRPVVRGSLFVAPPHSECRLKGDRRGPFDSLFVAFPETELQQIFGPDCGSGWLPPARSWHDPCLTSLMMQLWAQSHEQSLGDELMFEGTFISLIGRLLLLEGRGNSEPTAERGGGRIVQRALDYLQSNLSAKVSMTEVAAAAHVSPPYLARVFRRVTGRTVHEHLLDLRIRRAKELMTHFGRNMTLAQIAGQCGFVNHSHLTRSFSKFLGCTPQQFRQQVLSASAVERSE
jgi:AraC family transcriptional regulator